MGFIAKFLHEKFPKTTFLPIVHGDTLVAGIAPIGWLFSVGRKVAQNEAGLRAMAPSFDFKNFENFVELQWYGAWVLARQESFPEQWDTFVAGASSEIHFAPLEINRQNLLREGYPGDRVFVVGQQHS